MALTRSQQMARIRGRDTRPEIRLRRAVWAAGGRYRLAARVPVGRPDLVFPGPRVAAFVDGCFWHGCPEHYVRPRTRADFWAAKLEANVSRDRRHTAILEEAGWTVIRLWECVVETDVTSAAGRVMDAVCGRRDPREVEWRVWRVDLVDGRTDWERRHLVDLRDPTITAEDVGPRRSRSGRSHRGHVVHPSSV